MRSEPLFNDDIFGGLSAHYHFFFLQNDLFLYTLAVFLFMGLNCLAVHFFFKPAKISLLPAEKYVFAEAGAQKWGGLAVLALSFAAYAAATLLQENTLLNNFDLMSVNAVKNMYFGNLPIIDPIRFTPLANLDHNFVYAVTRNYAVIGIWVVLKQVLCLFLLYKFLAFIPVARRLILLAVINFLPSVFVVNNIIFAEQLILIFVLLSFMSAEKYAATRQFRYLLGFVLFVNLGIYTKETTVVFYAGLLGFLILARVFRGDIVPASFLSPFKTAASMPMEYLLFWSLFVFATFFFLVQEVPAVSAGGADFLVIEDAYMKTHYAPLPVVLGINKIALFLCVAALVLWGVKAFRQKGRGNFLFLEGAVFASTLVAVVIVFVLQIVVMPDYYKTYYLYLPAVFCTAYVFYFLRRPVVLACLFVPLALFSGLVNKDTFEREEGSDRHAAAAFIIAEAKKNPVDIYMHSREITAHKWWKVTGWGTALKYLYPRGDITVKTSLNLPNFHVAEDYYSYEVRRGLPMPGDYFMLHKINTPDFVPGENYRSVYENRIYKIYYIEPQDDNRTVSEN